MALKRPAWPQGRTIFLEHSSKILRGNPYGDATVRKVAVWLPPEYDEGRNTKIGQAARRFPVIYDLVGYTGSGLSHTNWRAFDDNIPERAARLMAEKKMGPTIMVFPDCFTALGGNQYVNSSAIGGYADYLTKEIIPFIDAELRTMPSREHRACFGKSSGGYGAMIHGMKYPQSWGAIANHSGDANFDFVYMNSWPSALTELMKHRSKARVAGKISVLKEETNAALGHDDGRVKNFLNTVWQKEGLSGGEIETLMLIAMAASYDPNPDVPRGFHLPFNLETGEIIPARWKQWQKHDPINMVGRYKANLLKLKGIYIDCGWSDQYHIHYGSRILSKRLNLAGVAHTYEEFAGTHSNIDHRTAQSLPFLYKAIA